MTTFTDIIETSFATVNLTDGTSTWKCGEWTPKRANKVERLIELEKQGNRVRPSDFED